MNSIDIASNEAEQWIVSSSIAPISRKQGPPPISRYWLPDERLCDFKNDLITSNRRES